MKLTLDVENTVTKRDGKMHLDPFEPTNKLVMVGCLTDTGKEYLFRDNFDGVQKLLDDATILIGHNIAYDLMWLWECGFNYDGAVFDTMLAEYVLQRGIKQPLSLEACALRYDLDTKKQDTLKEYFKKDMGVDEIPPEELSSYLSADLHATQQLSDCLYKKLNTVEYAGLMESVLLSNRVSTVLARIYQRGFSVDLSKLEEVRVEFQNEKQETEKRLQSQVNKLMGDTSINLNSPEQMSWVIYSRKPRDKSTWCNNFTPYMNKADFTHGLNSYSDIVYKTTAISCNPCYGTGYLKKVKKDGTPYLKHPKCDACSGSGYYFKPSDKVAGFKFNPPTAKWVTANGFSVNKNMLAVLQNSAKKSNQTEALQFLTDLQRVSALDTYLSSFVEGISTYVKPDNKLHVRLLQHRTSTGRFSGAEPNMQNMPRGGTFPVKKVFISRFDGGKILEADFAQLEFRAAAYLSQDEVAIEEVSTGFDVHAYTSKVISDAGQATTRQEAKAHTFAPLYGATGYGRSKAEAEYYEHFTEKYKGIKAWHSRLATEALEKRMITTPSGRQFAFPDVERRRNGTVSHFTQIKNYPVQSFATADIVPLILIQIENRLSQLQSCIVNSVHDSIVIDVHPDEIQKVIHVIKLVNSSITESINSEFKIEFNVPLLLESKIGDNWLDTKDVA
jgi:DNA polymerase I-like protein with 3'-5' exonuclease and polymerase domains|tara:strand:+ start:187 stop:2199 length:2013 start_codon:yes stop_codon:yes gene_type:complete